MSVARQSTPKTTKQQAKSVNLWHFCDSNQSLGHPSPANPHQRGATENSRIPRLSNTLPSQSSHRSFVCCTFCLYANQQRLFLNISIFLFWFFFFSQKIATLGIQGCFLDYFHRCRVLSHNKGFIKMKSFYCLDVIICSTVVVVALAGFSDAGKCTRNNWTLKFANDKNFTRIMTQNFCGNLKRFNCGKRATKYSKCFPNKKITQTLVSCEIIYLTV